MTAIKRQTTTGASGNINGSKISWGQRWVHRNENYTGRATVPVLWDRKTKTIVNNELSEIIRMLNSAFDAFGDASLDLYPLALRPEILNPKGILPLGPALDFATPHDRSRIGAG